MTMSTPETINDLFSPTSKHSSPESSNSNRLFGKYDVGRLLGHGGFGKVFYARNVETGQSVAIKAVSKRKVIKSGHVDNIKREITIMRRLRHPHIIKLIEVLATRTKIYFVLEFAKGGELFAKLTKGRFSEDLSRRYFQQLIAAVGCCHANGIFHRDLKPENMLLDENWNLKVSDFGLSAVKDQVRPDGRLHTQCGTPAYVAPEIIAKKGYDGAKVDVWSCGVILFVLNAGYLPFNDTNLMVMYRKIYRGQFRCPKWFSPELKQFLSRLLDTNPGTRITIDEIVEHPWFTRGGSAVQLAAAASGGEGGGGEEEAMEFQSLKLEQNEGNKNGERFMNAFDLISFSSGFDLSGLFSDSTEDLGHCDEIFLSAEPPERIMDEIEAAAAVEGDRKEEEEVVVVERRKERGLRVGGQNGEFRIFVGVHRLTEDLVVVEVRKREKDVGPGHQYWKDKLRPRICGLVYQKKEEPDSVSPCAR